MRIIVLSSVLKEKHRERILQSAGKAGFITGENICIDGGMTRQMIYHGEYGWTYDGR